MTLPKASISNALRLQDIQKRLPQISRSTLWRLRKTDGFPKPFQIMGIDYWHPEDIESWITEISKPQAA